MNIKGKIISGDFGKLIMRKKAGVKVELGELLITENKNIKTLLQVFDLSYGSQLDAKNIELASGLNLEKGSNLEFIDSEIRNYNLVSLKPLLHISDKVTLCKDLPEFFSDVRELEENDLEFLQKPDNPLFLGKLRSGSKVLNNDIFIDGKEALSHHILIPATTGRGKSNLTKCILWDILSKDYASCLVLDPHDEYYGRNSFGLKDHEKKNKVHYYTTKNVPPGAQSLKINITNLKPWHFFGVILLSDPQQQAMHLYYQAFSENWIIKILEQANIEGVKFDPATLDVLKRKLMMLLGIEEKINESGKKDYYCYGVFDFVMGKNTIPEICKHLDNSNVVIIDTSSLVGNVEILVGSIIANEVFRRHQLRKMSNELDNTPVVSIVLEEAPRVLANDESIFSIIAREGRKFKVGLIAITQLPSLIPRQILANMNTKIILGLEMAPERMAIIESASQDLSEFSRNIASLDKGEAIVTSNFTKFAVPLKIPMFEDFIKQKNKKYTYSIEGFK